MSNERLQAPLALGPAAEGAQDKDGAEQTATASALLAHNDKKPKDRQRIIGEVKEFLEEQVNARLRPCLSAIVLCCVSSIMCGELFYCYHPCKCGN